MELEVTIWSFANHFQQTMLGICCNLVVNQQAL